MPSADHSQARRRVSIRSEARRGGLVEIMVGSTLTIAPPPATCIWRAAPRAATWAASSRAPKMRQKSAARPLMVAPPVVVLTNTAMGPCCATVMSRACSSAAASSISTSIPDCPAGSMAMPRSSTTTGRSMEKRAAISRHIPLPPPTTIAMPSPPTPGAACPVEIEGHQQPNMFERNVECRSRARIDDPCVVDEHLHPVRACGRGSGHVDDRVRIGHIHAHGQVAFAQGRRSGPDCNLVDVCQYQRVTCSSERLRRCQPDCRSCACDQHDLRSIAKIRHPFLHIGIGG